ncbi:MAG: helix-hairpin-helix domain-containing protein [Candidatus Hodarchaeales archaeon]
MLKHFGSIEKIRTASVEELCQVEGISRSIGEKIFINFHADPENNK